MKEHDATEIAFKNGYKQGAMDAFAEIEREIGAALKSNYRVRDDMEDSDELYYSVSGKIAALRGIDDFIEELREKYE